ncbi:N-formylglutamate amidohydrolase [Alteromonas sp. 76-1]|uniref:N-formylglutamate amidohydrolase n=1 Tax=Alteromonas sp. 76-1 TaxID=2358187 RepID=UPI000FD18594|nr:N-formylglutamate amidohydrolase [Alteromonas sp. 76-1]VEL95148.1 N-formylglutamate amidohydrolase [Alteromonas sp. 76-1]
MLQEQKNKSVLSKCGMFGLLAAGVLFQIGCAGNKDMQIEAAEVSTNKTKSNVIFDDSWLNIVEGNMPLVISAPHGGTIKPDSIKDRTCGTGVKDDNTAELSFEIEQAFAKHDKKPYLVVAKIARTKIDLNRDLEQASCKNEEVAYTWGQYHKAIESAIDEAIETFGYALYIDLHGQSHPVRRLELGYLLKTPALEANYKGTDAVKNSESKTSIQNLINNSENLTVKAMLTGENAFGTIMEKSGFPAVPSFNDPFPKEGEAYFTGGYNTRRYTSPDYPNVFGMQIEANFHGVRNSPENRAKFAKAFAQSMNEYLAFIEANLTRVK